MCVCVGGGGGVGARDAGVCVGWGGGVERKVGLISRRPVATIVLRWF